MPIPPSESWKVESLRLTCFSTAPILIDNIRGAWRMVTGEEPETELKNRQSGTYSESGLFREGSQLEVRTEFNRVDWILYPASNSPLEEIVSIGGLESIDLFFGKLDLWLGEAKIDISRLAVGVVGLHQVPSRAECYRELSAYLPFVKLDPETSREFLFQINMPCQSKVLVGTELNRMARFAEARFKLLLGDLQGFKAMPEISATRIDLDFNSSADHMVGIEKAELTELKKELVSAAISVFTRGYAT